MSLNQERVDKEYIPQNNFPAPEIQKQAVGEPGEQSDTKLKRNTEKAMRMEREKKRSPTTMLTATSSGSMEQNNTLTQ